MSTEGDKIPQMGEEETALVLRIPDGALIPAGATFYDGDDDARCRLVKEDGTRCQATRMRAYGLCPGHAGIGGVARDPTGAGKLGVVERRRRSSTRLALGISARRAAQPVQQARIAAQARALDYATAIVDRPLDDPELGTIARQQAAIRALELLYPQVTAHLDLTMPEDEQGVTQLGWQDMQALASRLLDAGDQQ